MHILLKKEKISIYITSHSYHVPKSDYVFVSYTFRLYFLLLFLSNQYLNIPLLIKTKFIDIVLVSLRLFFF